MSEADCFVDRIIYRSQATAIGECRCRPSSDSWGKPREIQSGHILIFPRTSVSYCHEGKRPFVSTPNLVVFFNHRQPYRSKLVSSEGSWMEYFFIRPDILLEIIRSCDPLVEERPTRPFLFDSAVCPSRYYQLQRMLYHHVTSMPRPDSIFVDEQIIHVHAALVREGYRQSGGQRAPGSSRSRGERQREVAEALKCWLAERYLTPFQLCDVAAAVDMSMYHICRVFRRHVGLTIHRYLVLLRLRHSLELLHDPQQRLDDIARATGFAHQSHFTSAFRAEFQTTPAVYRSTLWNPSTQRVHASLAEAQTPSQA